ncbi:MAG: glycosyl hydrolase family 98 [Prevotellaceae bacterium]|nr:glycosyl hydrolase family 98 [Candidatus Minthosoma caballi]
MRKLLLTLFALVCFLTVSAQERRPIDNRHPAWMIHIDVWNNADPQKIINLIPNDIKPYVILNLSMSCSYDTDLKIYKKPQDALQTYRSWASVCCRNNMWFTCQPASGGHTHIRDNAANFNKALEIHESFFKDYKNFLGWNYAEQFWGFNEPNDASSSSDVDRIKLFAKLVPMHHQYGGFLTISFCGNIWSHPLNPVGMMKRNAAFLNACKENPEAILFLYKYTTSANWFNNESVTIAPFISGLAKNYGVRYDNCGWNGAADELVKKVDGKDHTYPGAVGIAPVLEQMTLNGACVWDGPELIWTEDFRGTSNTTTSSGYTRRNWGTYPNFDNIWVDMFRKVLDGTIYIPTREEVVERTKICIVNDMSASDDPTSLKVNAYAAPIDLYHGLYLQESDPFNSRSSQESGIGSIKGYGNNNFLYFKKTGRYQTIPVVIDLYDDVAKSIPVKVKRSSLYKKTKWGTQSAKVKEFDKNYPEISKGNLFVARHHNELTCYYPFSYLNKNKTASAEIPLLYNTCDSLKLNFGKFSSGLIHEYADSITLYMNNYRSDSTAQQTDIITITGCKSQPSVSYKKRAKAAGAVTEAWNEETRTYTCTLKHNGPYDLVIKCEGDGKDRLTDYVETAAISEIPVQPEDYYGELVIEAEDMDYKSISACVIDQYNDGWGAYRSVRGHSAMGFARMGTSTSGSLRNDTKINFSGKYNVTIKYQAATAGKLQSSFNGTNGGGNHTLDLEATGTGWKTVSYEATAKAGTNIFLLTNKGGKDCYIDNVTFTPIELDILVGIEGIENDAVTERVSFAKEYYSLSGARLASPQRGINIVRMPDGSTKKIVVK